MSQTVTTQTEEDPIHLRLLRRLEALLDLPISTLKGACPTDTTSHPKTTHPFDEVCMVLDLQYFCSGRQILPRELAWCDHTGKHHRSIHYKPAVAWSNLSAQDRRMAHHVSKHVHGLPYYPRASYHVASELVVDVRRLYLPDPPTFSGHPQRRDRRHLAPNLANPLSRSRDLGMFQI